ncbi:alpha/beta hydrolase [candidate division WOR-3 bacterium]|nr:alpha/beta hydrolase [candidate division WOR-3 bacterium]
MKKTENDTTTAQAIPAPTAKVKVSDSDELEVWVVGEGTPVVMVHGALLWNLFKPLVDELAKKDGYQLIWYHRRGYRGKPTEAVELADHAPDIIKILDELEISKAHVVGHSLGANIVLELAMYAPNRLLSAVLLETVMLAQVESAKEFGEVMKPVMAKAESGDFEGASADFIADSVSKEFLERVLPGSWAEMVTDAPTWWTMELPAIAKWTVDPAKVKAIEIPLALVLSSDLPYPHVIETSELLKKWQPKAKRLEVPGSDNHFYLVTETAKTAAILDDWIKSQGTTN